MSGDTHTHTCPTDTIFEDLLFQLQNDNLPHHNLVILVTAFFILMMNPFTAVFPCPGSQDVATSCSPGWL